ncbi:natriuretic peptides B isoform X1 [Psammomys obesus]|uniref:natriuretic peptides B isoform X1 n=1 Tax=Psammomys obesus TaxID=48139 RepID=UPI002452FE25|nr:natriuretic peptides B isoform X1 [Psammomys obesus]
MDLQNVLPQMILLLLFLSLSPLGGRAHPLGSPSQSPEQFKMQVSPEGLHGQIGVCLRVWAAAMQRSHMETSHVRIRKQQYWVPDPLTNGHHEGWRSQSLFLNSRLPNSLQKLLDLMREKSEETAQMQLPKNQGPTKESPKRTLGSQDRALQVLQRLRNSKVMHSSSCFGQRIDRIGSVSRLGCNVLKRF